MTLKKPPSASVTPYAPFIERMDALAGTDPLVVFRRLRRRFGKKKVAFFRRSSASESGFIPSQTVIGIDPFETLRTQDGVTEIENASGRSEQKGNPYTILAERLATYRSNTIPAGSVDRPDFTGGALGYLSYDSVRHLEKVLVSTPGNLRDARKPHDMEMMFYKKFVVFEHSRKAVYIVSLVKVEAEELKVACLTSYGAAAETPATPSDEAMDTAEMECMMGKAAFLAAVKRLKEHIRAGDIFQAVVSEKFRTPFEGDALELFEILSRLSPAPYQFFMDTGERIVLGASPEMLLRVQKGELETHPIAGTRPRGKDAADEKRLERQLLRSVKERAEHLMLVDLARNDLGRVSRPGTVRLESFMKLKKFSAVMHLVSRVQGNLVSDMHAIDALAACFPAGTLSGAPKIRAMQILSEIEPEARGFYGGAFILAGYDGDLDSCISIRSIAIENGIASVQAGAGIVADSNPEREYQEVQHKTRSSRRALAQLNAEARRLQGVS